MPQQRTNPLPERIAPLDELVNVLEVEEVARRRLDRAVFDHVAAGAGGGDTLRRNREAFDRITLRPRMLVDVTQMDLSTELFGQKLYAPLLVAPTARHARLHPEGEPATTAGAGAAKTAMVVSGEASFPIEKIAARAAAPLWFQVYPESDSSRLRAAIQRATGAGCRVVVLTVGAVYEPPREADLHNRFSRDAPRPGGPLRPRGQTRMGWDVLQQVRDLAKVPVLLKGILSAEEASLAVEKGAAGIIVSNHGGRFADGVPATIEVLPRVVEAVGRRVPVLVDSGFRRGTDILKALALGARAVLVGRPVLWGLAAYGAEGVRAVLEMLQSELALAMGLSGKANLAAVDSSLVKIHRW